MAEDKRVKDLLLRHDKLKSSRYNWDSHWEDIAENFLPVKKDVYMRSGRVKGDNKYRHLYDSSGVMANELLASALHGMLTNPSVQFFELSSGIPAIDDIHRVRLWLQKAVRRMHQVLNNSNFQTEIHEVYLDQGSFGTGAMMIEEDDDLIVRFHARPIYEMYIAESRSGVVEEVHRELVYKGRQILEEFDNNVFSDQQKRTLQDNLETEYDIIHIIRPRKKYDPFKLNQTNKPFGSFWVWKQEALMLKESGYNEFPLVVPRWSKFSGETYGRSPAMKVLPEVKMLNQMMKTTIEAGQLAVRPPLNVPDENMFPPEFTPGGLNYYRAGTKDRTEPLYTGADPRLGHQLIELVINKVNQAFYLDQLKLEDGDRMTATEVLQRTEEKLRLLGPILGRQHFELLKPLVDRVFAIMLRKGELPPDIPPELSDRKLEVQYSSMIARAQRSSEAENLNRVMALMAPLAEFDPSVMDNVNPDEILKYFSNIFNVPQDIFRSEDEKADIRQQRARQQQQQQEMQQQMATAETIQKTAPLIQGE
jgi:hypothetical protein